MITRMQYNTGVRYVQQKKTKAKKCKRAKGCIYVTFAPC